MMTVRDARTGEEIARATDWKILPRGIQEVLYLCFSWYLVVVSSST